MISPRLLTFLIHDHGAIRPEAPAILSPGKKELSYQRLSQHIHSIALQLTRLGIRPGDRVAVVLPNGAEMATAFLAISSVCTCAPLNPAYPLEEFRFSMADLHVKALVALAGNDRPDRKAAAGLGIPIISLEPDTHIAGIFSLACSLPSDETIAEPVLAGIEDVALVLHTSGTTSRPKIVPLTHFNIIPLGPQHRRDVCPLPGRPLFEHDAALPHSWIDRRPFDFAGDRGWHRVHPGIPIRPGDGLVVRVRSDLVYGCSHHPPGNPGTGSKTTG